VAERCSSRIACAPELSQQALRVLIDDGGTNHQHSSELLRFMKAFDGNTPSQSQGPKKLSVPGISVLGGVLNKCLLLLA
jgi:hypothetical protein